MENRRGDRSQRVEVTDFVHTGPGTLAGRYMRQFWQPICLSRDVEKGRARRERIMSQYVTLYRGESGKAHAVADRCPHRGTQLSVGWVEGDCIRCFYHGWKFDADGQCVEMPAETDSFAAKMNIESYPTEEYLGLVFVFLGEGDPPVFPRYPELEDERDGLLATQARAPMPCNFYQRIENNVDQVHVAFAHRDIFRAEGVGEVPRYEVEETSYGICARGIRPGKEDRLTYFQMPNVAVLMVPPGRDELAWVPFVVWRVPVDDEHNRSFSARRIRTKGNVNTRPDRSPEQIRIAQEIIDGKLYLDELDPEDRQLLVPVQDNIALMAQGRIVDRREDHLGKSDVGIILVRKLWREELQALADGRPLRPWLWPKEGVRLTSGAESVDA